MNALLTLLILAIPDTSPRGERFDARSCDLARIYSAGEEAVFAAATAPGGLLAAAGRRDGSIVLFEPVTGRFLLKLTGHEGYVYGVAFSPNGKTLASAGMDKTVRLWDATDGHMIAVLNIHEDVVHAVTFTPDGRYLVSAGLDGARLWDLSKRKRVHDFASGPSSCVAVKHDGKRMVVGGLDGASREYDLVDGKLMRTLEGSGSCVLAVAYKPGTGQIATARLDGLVQIWGDRTGVVGVAGIHGAVYSLAFTGDGRQLVWGGAQGVRVLDVWSHKTLKSFNPGVPVYGVAIAQGGQGILATCADNRFRLWGRRSGGAVADDPIERAGGFLGVSYNTNGGGAQVTSVVGDSQAEKTGFQANDVIIGIDNVPVTQSDDFLNFMKGSFENQEVWLKIKRGESERFVRAKLGHWK